MSNSYAGVDPGFFTGEVPTPGGANPTLLNFLRNPYEVKENFIPKWQVGRDEFPWDPPLF